jgi:hypothetical protein
LVRRAPNPFGDALKDAAGDALTFVDPNEDALAKAVAKQPVIINIQYVDDLQSYKRGIMD